MIIGQRLEVRSFIRLELPLQFDKPFVPNIVRPSCVSSTYPWYFCSQEGAQSCAVAGRGVPCGRPQKRRVATRATPTVLDSNASRGERSSPSWVFPASHKGYPYESCFQKKAEPESATGGPSFLPARS